MKGARLAVFGLARSGLSVAKAALARDARVTVVEESRGDSPQKQAISAELVELGADIRLQWDGTFSSGEFDFVVTSPGVPMRHEKLQDAKAKGLPVHSEVEFAYRLSRAPIIAVTGTNGKSTTTAMAFECLRASGHDAVLCGNIFGSGYAEVPLTEAASQSRPDQVLVAEVSSFQLEWVSTFRPLAGAITNIRPDHLDRYDSFEEYADTKRRVFLAQGADDFAVTRQDRLLAAFPTQLTFGPRGSDAVVDENSLTVLGHRIPLTEFQVLGTHNHENAAVALLLAAAANARLRAAGLTIPTAAIGAVTSFKGIAHRMESLGERNGVRIINNSMCTNPAAVIASSQSIPARQHLLLGGTNKRLDFAPLRDHLEAFGHTAYLFGKDAADLQAQLGAGARVFEDLAEAFSDAVRNANPGDVVMLAPGCASMDQFEDFRDRGNVFKAMAKEWLDS